MEGASESEVRDEMEADEGKGEDEEEAKGEEGFEEARGKGGRRRRKAGRGKGRGKGVPLDLPDLGRPSSSTNESYPPYIATGLLLRPSAKPYASTPRVSSVRSLAPPGPRFGSFPPLQRGTVPISGSRPTMFTTRPTSPVYTMPTRPTYGPTYGPPEPQEKYIAPGIRMLPGFESPTSDLYTFDPPTSLPGQAGPTVVSQAGQSGTSQAGQSGTSQAGLGGTSHAQTGMAPRPDGAITPDYRWDSSQFLQVRDKTCVVSETPGLVWWVVSDSHTRNLKVFFRQNGANLATISGGQIDHVREFALVHKPIINQSLRALFILAGGNDLVIPNIPVVAVANNLMNLVNQIHTIRPEVTVITGSVVCRKEGICFVDRQIELDNQIQRASPTHHHFITDAFSIEPTQPYGQREPRGLLYGPDGVHLNAGGEKVLSDILGLIFEAVNTDNYSGRNTLYFKPNDQRSVYFKF